MNTALKKDNFNKTVLLFTLTYMVSYMTRINFGAIISEMERATQISRSLLSMSLTGSFVTYGAGQIISGVLGDKFPPKKLITYGFLATIIMNFIIPLCQNPYQMLFVWCINGFAQAFMWPPMVKLATTLFSEGEYKKAVAKISWGSSSGTIAVYLLSPVIISFFSWKGVFFFSAICGIIMMLVWNRSCEDIRPEEKKEKEGKKASNGVLFSPFMISIMVAIILQGMLRDGVTTWMPTYISETYNMSNLIAILTGVIMPVFSIICFQITTSIYTKKLKSPVLCGGVIFLAGAVSSLALLLLSGSAAFLSVLFCALLTGCMHGVNLMLICMLPAYFKKYGNVSTVSGVLNSCTYIGSAISTYGIALLSEKFSWGFTLFTWLLTAVVGTVICFLCVKPWNKNFKEL